MYEDKTQNYKFVILHSPQI